MQNEHISASKDNPDKILAEVLQNHGWVPKPLKVMAKRPGALEAFMAYRDQVFETGPLSPKERALVSLSTAVALKSAECLPVHANRARKAGASEEEIIQTLLIASIISSTSPLHVAYAGINDQ